MSNLKSSLQTVDDLNRKPSELSYEQANEIRKATGKSFAEIHRDHRMRQMPGDPVRRAMEFEEKKKRELEAASEKVSAAQQIQQSYEDLRAKRGRIGETLTLARQRLAICKDRIQGADEHIAMITEFEQLDAVAYRALLEQWMAERLPKRIAILEAELEALHNHMEEYARSNGINVPVL